MKPFANQTIVLPFDFSDSSRRAVEYVLNSSDENSPLHLIHVVEPIVLLSLDSSVPAPPNFYSEAQERAIEKMNETFAKDKDHRITIHCQIGDPGSEIVSLGRSVEADLIVMPSHGRSGISRLLLGSVAERVLRLASCPVLVLRGEWFNAKGK